MVTQRSPKGSKSAAGAILQSLHSFRKIETLLEAIHDFAQSAFTLFPFGCARIETGRKLNRSGNGLSVFEDQELLTQRKRPDSGRFRLQVDRQTKGSYAYEAAEAAGMAIKNDYPMLQVAVYDSVESVHKIIGHT